MIIAPTAENRYDQRTITLHWLAAALVASLWLLGQTIDWFPKGDARVAARSTHIVLGVTLAVVLVLRLRWRFGNERVALAGVGAGWMQSLSSITHKGLYALLAGTVLLGLSNAWARGDTVFGLFTLPALTTDAERRDLIANWHGLAANGLMLIALLHAGAALMHHFVFKDEVLRRMWPRR